jgi:hypothetical protein
MGSQKVVRRSDLTYLNGGMADSSVRPTMHLTDGVAPLVLSIDLP